MSTLSRVNLIPFLACTILLDACYEPPHITEPTVSGVRKFDCRLNGQFVEADIYDDGRNLSIRAARTQTELTVSAGNILEGIGITLVLATPLAPGRNTLKRIYYSDNDDYATSFDTNNSFVMVTLDEFHQSDTVELTSVVAATFEFICRTSAGRDIRCTDGHFAVPYIYRK